ncbi:uncharacterized protein LOC132641461 [Lycium barbarum]|uniref:uncharacterized protein LOC132641461 n=1 Tax=Lycium barbarum TaxID=112863 RepID=UPI00293F496A|nr:uncharacterized protein LOC132641461 [Lycium barbarum]
MSLALEFENKLSPMRSNRESNWTPTNRPVVQNPLHSVKHTQNDATSSSAHQNLRSSVSSNPVASQPFQSGSWDTERRNLMAKGVCYRCHEKFAPGHICKPIKLSLMEITAGDQLDGVDEVNATDGDYVDPQETDIVEISFHAILGNSVGTTMKLQGEINKRRILILVDSGSTLNFVAESIIKEHKLPVESVPTFGVQIGNGDIIRCSKVSQNLQIQLPGPTITQDYYPFALAGADLVFGIKWLASLNTFKLTGKICS